MAGNKILVIDADSASRNLVAAALSEQGYQILHASSGREGLVAAWRDRPELIILEPALADLKGELLAERLRSDARTATVPLVAFSSDPEFERIRSCIEAGFREYMIKTPEALPALVAAVGRLLGKLPAGVVDTVAKAGGLQIAFLSAKGGTGTSSLCVNLAMNIGINQPESHIVVADLVLPIGSIAGIVDYEGDQNIGTIAGLPSSDTTPDFFRDSFKEIPSWHIHLLAGSPDPGQGTKLKFDRILEIVQSLRSSYDFVLLDLGRSLSRISLPLIEQADLIVMIISTDSSTISLTKSVWDYLQSKGVKAGTMFMILNRAIGVEGLTKIEAEKIVGLDIKTALPNLGGNFSLANNQHIPYSLKFPTDTASIILKDTARQMVEQAQRLRAGP
jgi:pilus assembly protein CpaE